MSLALLILAAVPAEASAATTPSTQSSKTVSDPHKVICKRLPTTGSRLDSERICMTKVEWAERTRQDQEDLKRMGRTVEPGN